MHLCMREDNKDVAAKKKFLRNKQTIQKLHRHDEIEINYFKIPKSESKACAIKK